MAGVPGAPPPTPARPRIRWGLPDAGLAWLAGVIAALITGSIVASAAGVPADRVSDDVGVLPTYTRSRQTADDPFLTRIIERLQGVGPDLDLELIDDPVGGGHGS